MKFTWFFQRGYTIKKSIKKEIYMYSLVSKLVVYRNIGADSILFKMADIVKDVRSGDYDKDEITSRLLDRINELLLLATDYGFDKNLWHGYIAYLFAVTENPFTMCSEKKGAVDGSINELAMNDFVIFKELLDYDFSHLEKELSVNVFSVITNYRAVEKDVTVYNKNASLIIRELQENIEKSGDAKDLYNAVMDFYEKYGVGVFGLNKAFRISESSGRIIPITQTSDVTFDDLVGYEMQKQELIKNTKAFVSGKPSNNVLLYGDAGTGKSSSVKALLNMFYKDGLRIIELYKHDIKRLTDIISVVKGRNYRFIIYMDDLSFESMETEYKHLKAVIEGDLEEKPSNVLIYATSNRRHLIHETFSDRRDGDDIHKNDTVAERMSLSARFGVTIGYFRPERQQYYEIVKKLAGKEITEKLTETGLLAEADRWALRHGGMSGRTARQFADHINGR